MRHIQFTLNDEEFLMLRSVCVIKNTNLKAFSREAVLEHVRKFLSDDSKESIDAKSLVEANLRQTN